MPRGDRTGPRGMGPMTGRGAGYCSGSAVPGYMNPWGGRGGGYGRGFGRGLGLGRGFGGYWGVAPGYVSPVYSGAPSVDPQIRVSALRAQAEELKRTLSDVQREIETLEAHDKE